MISSRDGGNSLKFQNNKLYMNIDSKQLNIIDTVETLSNLAFKQLIKVLKKIIEPYSVYSKASYNSIVFHCSGINCVVLYSIVLYCVVLYCIVLYFIVLY